MTASIPGPELPSAASRVEPPRTWWRRNRWYVLSLPVALTLAVAGYSYRIEQYFLENEFVVSLGKASVNDWLTVSDPGWDAAGNFNRDYQARVRSSRVLDELAEPTSELEKLPADSELVEVTVEFRADPNEPMRYCKPWLVDKDGRSYGEESKSLLGAENSCVSLEQPGPDIAHMGNPKRPQAQPDEVRPETWTTRLTFLVPKGTEAAELRLGWDAPHYAQLRLR